MDFIVLKREKFCVDNASMIAWAAMERLKLVVIKVIVWILHQNLGGNLKVYEKISNNWLRRLERSFSKCF